MDQQTWNKLKGVLKYALKNRHSSFYKDKYRASGINSVSFFKTRNSFYRIPFLTKTELINTPPFKRVFTSSRKIEYAVSTSGTSGLEPLIIFRGKDAGCYDYFFLNIPPKKFILLLSPHRIINFYLRTSGKFPLFVGNIYQMPETAVIAAKLEIDSIIAGPDVLIKFSEFLKSHYDLKKIKFIRIGGANLNKEQKAILTRLFPQACMVQGYGLGETAMTAFQCKILAKKLLHIYHIRNDKLFFEIIPEDKKRANVGEIVLTHLQPEPSLLIRYKTGDLGQWVNKKCQCGSKFPLIKVLGRRNYDKIKIGGLEIHKENFECVLKEFDTQIEDSFTAHFYQRMIDDKIVGEIVVDLTPRPHIQITPDIQAIIEETLNRELRVSNRFSFKDFVARGLFFPIKVNFVKQEKVKFKAGIAKKLVPHF